MKSMEKKSNEEKLQNMRLVRRGLCSKPVVKIEAFRQANQIITELERRVIKEKSNA